MAGRIARATVELVKERADLVELVTARTGPARRVGARYAARCPFHDERTPSFSIDPQAGLYHCFGCGVGGDVIRFVQEIEALPFDAAVEWLADRYGVEVEREELSPQEERVRRRQGRIEALLEETADFYARYLAASPQAAAARAYLEERGIEADSVERFRLGFAPPDWDRVARAAAAKGYSTEELEATGLVVRGRRGPIDRFRGRLMFPLADARGRVRGFGARVMPGGEGPKYLNSPESDVFHKGRTLYGLHLARAAIARAGHALVVEGYTDVIALHAAGHAEAVASMGTSLTDEQLRELHRLASSVTLCFDADAAGQEAALRGMRAAERLGLRVRIVPLPAGQDPADLVARGAEAVAGALERAESVLSFEVGRILARLAVDGPDRVYASAQAVLQAVPATPERDDQVRRVASALRLDAEMQGGLAGRRRPGPAAATRVRRRLAADERLERELLAAALAAPSRGARVLEEEAAADTIEDEGHRALIPWLLAHLAGERVSPPEGLEPVAAESVAMSGRFGLDEAPSGEQLGERLRALEQLRGNLQLRRIARRRAALKDRLDSDDYSREDAKLDSDLARQAEAIKARMRAGGL